MKNVATIAVCCALAVASLASPLAEAGRTRGPGVQHSRVYAGGTVVFDDVFRGGQLAEILVEGDGDTDLDVYVYDENGNLIDSDTDYGDLCLVQWSPKWTGTFRIEVRNLGSVYNDFTIVTN